MDHRSVRKLVLVIIADLAIAHCPLLAQTAATPVGNPKFEVASIRQNNNPNPGWQMYFTADGVHATDVTLLWALHQAYGINDSDLWSGGPAWLDKTRFDIEAKYDVSQYPNLTPEQRQAMLQQLLADRFKVIVHHEQKEVPLYALAIAKSGAKVEKTKEEDLRKSPEYGVMCVRGKGSKGGIKLQGCTMTQFASNLSGYARNDLGRRVVDQTGLAGYYTIALHWSPVDMTNPSTTDLSASETSGPSIFTAVKEQLGMELKPIKGPLDTIVIDHAEMPSEN
jgi:uncharacterized protein (TIGR03435 family)